MSNDPQGSATVWTGRTSQAALGATSDALASTTVVQATWSDDTTLIRRIVDLPTTDGAAYVPAPGVDRSGRRSYLVRLAASPPEDLTTAARRLERPGVFGVNVRGRLEAAAPGEGGRVLVLIPGAFLDAEETFGPLLRCNAWRRVATTYRSILAFNPAGLTDTPDRNALTLLEALPEGATVDLLTHGLGGRVAHALDAAVQPGARGPVAERCVARRVSIRRVVRVACPALGTTIGRLGAAVAANVLLSACQRALGRSEERTAHTEALFRALVAADRLDGLPGLHPFGRHGGLPPQAVGKVIGVGARAPGQRTLDMLSRLLPGFVPSRDSDGVVDLDSALAAAEPAEVLQEAVPPHHYAWFHHRAARSQILESLLDRDEPKSVLPSLGGSSRAATSLGRSAAPRVLFVPSVLGSTLVEPPNGGGIQRKIWPSVDYLHSGAPGAPWSRLLDAAVAGALIASPWTGLDGVTRERDVAVATWPFDFRALDGGLDPLVASLGKALTDAWSSDDGPLHVVGFGMGGVLVRLALERHAGAAFTARHGVDRARVVLVGSPLAGSWAAACLLAGHAALVEYLAMLGPPGVPGHTIAGVFRAMPGLVSLLPTECLQGSWWPADLMTPEFAGHLKIAAQMTERNGRIHEHEGVFHVFGNSPATPCGGTWMDGTFRPTWCQRGDGLVSHPDRLDGATYLVEAPHWQALTGANEANGALDLLLHGESQRLLPVRGHRGPGRPVDPPPRRPVLYPRDTDLERAALGVRATDTKALRVRVVHGNLALVSDPAVVGHLAGGGLRGPEVALDHALGGELGRRNRIDNLPKDAGEPRLIYPTLEPGRVGPSVVVIVGLGEEATLSRPVLVRAVRAAVVELVLALRGDGAPTRVAFAPPGRASARISPDDAVAATLQGVLEANRELTRMNEPGVVSEVHLVAVYGDEASDLARSALTWARAPTLELFPTEAVDVDRWVVRQAAVRDLTPYRPPREPPHKPFTSLTVRFQAPDTLEFTGSEGAVAAREAQEVQWSRVQALCAGLTQSSSFVPNQVKAAARHLIPPGYLRMFQEGRDLQLTVGHDTATLPWEAFVRMEDPDHGAGGILVLLRQLEHAATRTWGAPAHNGEVLIVVGDHSGAAQLEAAEREASHLGTLFRERGYEAGRAGPDWQSAVEEMGREHEIVHLVGHGTLDPRPQESGLVMAGGVLNSIDVRAALREHPPAVVFVNACSLGRIEGDSSAGLAARLATTLMSIGVRVVVAAGWQVDDDAAASFALRFYGELLEGRTLRDAVGTARSAARRSSPDSATWAAYQVYGDPNFVLPSLGHGRTIDRQIYEVLDHPHAVMNETEVVDILKQALIRYRIRRRTQADDYALAWRTLQFFLGVPSDLQSPIGWRLLSQVLAHGGGLEREARDAAAIAARAALTRFGSTEPGDLDPVSAWLLAGWDLFETRPGHDPVQARADAALHGFVAGLHNDADAVAVAMAAAPGRPEWLKLVRHALELAAPARARALEAALRQAGWASR